MVVHEDTKCFDCKPPNCQLAYTVLSDMQASGRKVLPSNRPGELFDRYLQTARQNEHTGKSGVTTLLSDWILGPLHRKELIPKCYKLGQES